MVQTKELGEEIGHFEIWSQEKRIKHAYRIDALLLLCCDWDHLGIQSQEEKLQAGKTCQDL